MKKIKNVIRAVTPYGIINLRRRAADVRKSQNNELFPIQVHVVEHCNLKCKSCLHFSPLANEEYLEPDKFEKDCARLSKLTDRLTAINLLGGEPLLHPELTTIIEIARKYFKNTLIKILTNGILLVNQPQSFWDCCRKNRATISISTYPIYLEIEKIEQLAQENSVYLKYNEEELLYKSIGKLMYKIPLDIHSKRSAAKNYINHCSCWNSNNVTLAEGKLYQCFYPAFIRHFNNYFKTNFEINSLDSVDIYKAKNKKEILDFLHKPFPFCKYCKRNKVSFFSWSASRKDISEWI